MLKQSLVVPSVLAAAIIALAPAQLWAGDGKGKTNQDWWPDTLDLAPLRSHAPRSNPYGGDFNYAEAFAITVTSANTAPPTRNSRNGYQSQK